MGKAIPAGTLGWKHRHADSVGHFFRKVESFGKDTLRALGCISGAILVYWPGLLILFVLALFID